MKKIKAGITFPSAALCLTRRLVRYYHPFPDRVPRNGDVVYGEVIHIGEHSSLENKSARIHMIHNGTPGIFVFGNRYAPDYYEGFVPDHASDTADLLARSGIIGIVKNKNALRKDPTRIRILGYVCDENERVLNTREHPIAAPKQTVKKFPRSPLILICGTSMNSGKSVAAAACCRALSTSGFHVRATKVTGTASLKDILHMNDAGAIHYADFTYLGYPSTYGLPEREMVEIFNKLDLRYANNPKNYWVVEFADGIIQRETALLLQHPEVRRRIHRLIFCARDAFGAIGGIRVLKEKFDLVPDAISGICSSSPLHLQEVAAFTEIPAFNSFQPDVSSLLQILIHPEAAEEKSAVAAPRPSK